MARPKKEETNEIESGVEVVETTAPDAPQMGSKREYNEYEVTVRPILRNTDGGNRLAGYEGKIAKHEAKRTAIRIDPWQADTINRQWYNRKLILLEVGDESTSVTININSDGTTETTFGGK